MKCATSLASKCRTWGTRRVHIYIYIERERERLFIDIYIYIYICTSAASTAKASPSRVAAGPRAPLDASRGVVVAGQTQMVILTWITVIILELIHVPKPDFLEGLCLLAKKPTGSEGTRRGGRRAGT